MANLLCAKVLQGETIRVTKLDVCGEPEFGACAFGVSDGYATATMTPEEEAGVRFLKYQANGVPSFNQRSKPVLNWYKVSIEYDKVDPELFILQTGATPIYDYATPTPNVIGFDVSASNYATGSFAFEIWMGNAEDECPEDGLIPYGYQLLPWVVEGRLTGDVVVTNNTVSFTIEGRTRLGTPWGVGPYDVVLDDAGLPAPPATAVATDVHDRVFWTYLPPPEAECGCQELES